MASQSYEEILFREAMVPYEMLSAITGVVFLGMLPSDLLYSAVIYLLDTIWVIC